MIVCERTPDIFHYELNGQSENNANLHAMHIIEDKVGEPVGYLQHSKYLGAMGLTALWYELTSGVSWLEVTPAVVRYLWKTGQTYAKRDNRSCTSFGFMLGAEHPAYEAIRDRLPTIHEPYAWYLRVADLPAFLNHIRPVLEKRLADSIVKGYSREIKISFYRTGLRLVIENGRIATIEKWSPSPKTDEGNIAFPGLTFLQLVFGYRSYEELHYAFPDCWCDDEDVRVLLNIVFPKKVSDVFPVA
jgi:hypothetical protein